MKKVFVFLLVCIVTTGAFAQFRFRFTTDVNSFLFSYVAPTGLYAQAMVPDAFGDLERNMGVPASTLERGLLFAPRNGNTGYYVPSSYSFFANSVIPETSVFRTGVTWLPMHAMAFFFSYTNGIFQAYAAGDVSQLFVRLGNRDFGNATFNSLLDIFHIGEWWLRVNHDLVTFYIGDRNFPGKVDHYNDFTGWSERLRVDLMGVMQPLMPGDGGTGSYFIFRPRENSLFRELLLPNDMYVFAWNGYMVGSIKLLNHFFDIPITVDVGMSIGESQSLAINGSDINPGQSRIAGGMRISGEGIANLFNFDLTYRMRGGDPTRDESWSEDNPAGGFQPDGRGAWSHLIGAAVGFPLLVPNLGMSMAYTALFATYEDQAIGEHSPGIPVEQYRTITRTGPAYHGFDVRMRYTGIPGMRLTFNNNVSFAKAGEPVYNEDDLILGHSIDIYGRNMPTRMLDRYQSQSWLALYNAFALRYQVSSLMNATLEVAHRTGIITTNNSDENRLSAIGDWGTSKRAKTMLGTSIYASFSFTSAILFEVGASLWFENTSTTFSNYLDGGPGEFVTTSWSGGGVAIGIPFRLAIRW